ncbi:MAG: hypothetical protein HC797_07765 [Anaerolineales bacterium]|nr:hypothetical protein [Anaerolineales bacterium]
MLEQRTKIVVLIFLTFVVFTILITAGKTKTDTVETPINNNEQLPIRWVRVTFAQNQHDQLFEQLNKFADKHAFAIRIRPTAAPDDRFLVQMWREDIKIIGLDSKDPGLFEIGFYNTYNERPIPIQVFDELIIDLKVFISEIDGVVILEGQ